MLILILLAASAAHAEDWPQFRGPTGQGHSTETGLPATWSESSNIRWKVEIPGNGWSSPSIQGDRIWLTTATEDGHSLRVITVDKATGKIQLDVEVFKLDDPGKIHDKNTHASPTPIVSGDRVYVHFGGHGTAALDTSGRILWKKRFAHQHLHGPGNSPTLAGGLLFINCDGTDAQFVVAVDPETGEERWRKTRKSWMSFATPLAVQDGDNELIISPGAHRTIAYDAKSGDEVWSVSYGDGFSNVPRPVVAHGMVYLCTGFYQTEVLAVKLGGRGDITESNIVWRTKSGAPLTPSPLIVGDILYYVSDRGIGSAVDAKTGRLHWRQRIDGNHSASPLFADGRIYFLSEEGEATVVAPGPEYKVLAKNQLDGRFLASIAVSDKALFLRSDSHLYRVQTSE